MLQWLPWPSAFCNNNFRTEESSNKVVDLPNGFYDILQSVFALTPKQYRAISCINVVDVCETSKRKSNKKFQSLSAERDRGFNMFNTEYFFGSCI